MKSVSVIFILIFALMLHIDAQIPAEGLVASYPFNGNADEEGGNNGTVYGATLTTDRFGNSSSAYFFNGTSDYIELPNIIPVYKGAISYWYNTSGSSEGQILVYNSNTTDNGFGTIHNAMETHTGINGEGYNVFVVDNGAGTGQTDSIVQVELDTWYHVVVTYDVQDSARMYIDGNLVHTVDLSAETGTYLPTTTLIGKPTMNTRYFHGVFDDLRIYSALLDDSEITALFNEGKCYETVYDTVTTIVYDTTFVSVYDTTFVTIKDTIKVYEYISVTDTLIIDAVLTGVEAPDHINTLKVYPNPAKDHLFIHTGDYTRMDGYSLKIINQLGALVFETNVEDQIYEVNLSTWTGMGLYFLQVIDSGGGLIDIRKIILE